RDGFDFTITIQVDLPSYRLPSFIEKAHRAGCKRAFLGMESINPQVLIASKKYQNKIWEYRKLFSAWRAAGIMTYVGYIVGFPVDTPETIARDIAIIQREIPLDLLEFFILTPLPGSADHKALIDQGVPLEPDTNQYNVCHVTVDHPLMTRIELYGAFRNAWRQYYSNAHVTTIFRRALAARSHISIFTTALYAGSMDIEGEHPLEIGFLRRKVRSQRRPGFPIEPRLHFYPRRLLEILIVQFRWAWLFARFGAIKLIARWENFRSLHGEWLACSKDVMGKKLIASYFSKIPESQRRTVRVLKELEATIVENPLPANLDRLAAPPRA
ncbi:MAG: radical SAM protein, partial [Acidobacteria bacterium]|nr:radical SAM protein [Acidobacteriota bacterium]